MSSTGARGYNHYYKHIAVFPELGIFRCFGAFWAKRLHDETSELLACLVTLEDELKKWPQLDAITVLDCPKRLAREICPKKDKRYKPLHKAWAKYDMALVRYGEIFCMSERIMNLPKQDKFDTKQLGEWKLPDFKPLFDSNEFVPTGEDAATYQDDPDQSDTRAWRTMSHGDFLTKRFRQASPWIDEHILARWRWLVHGIKPTNVRKTSSKNLSHLVGAMDTLTCLFASLSLALTVVVLALVRPLSIRITLIGIFGTLFALLLKLMAGSPTRGEVFGATAAFYAVAVVFVGSTNNDCACS